MCIMRGTDTFLFAVLSRSKWEEKAVGYSYRQSNGRGQYVKECPGQYLQNKFQDQKRCHASCTPP